MFQSVIRLFFVVAVLAAFGGWQATVVRAQTEAELEVIPVGRNLVDENCRAELNLKQETQSGREFRIFCGKWEQPSGRVVELQIGDAPELVRQRAEGGSWKSRLDLRAVCDEGEESQILDAVETLFYNCKLRNGGWPYIRHRHRRPRVGLPGGRYSGRPSGHRDGHRPDFRNDRNRSAGRHSK